MLESSVAEVFLGSTKTIFKIVQRDGAVILI